MCIKRYYGSYSFLLTLQRQIPRAPAPPPEHNDDESENDTSSNDSDQVCI